MRGKVAVGITVKLADTGVAIDEVVALVGVGVRVAPVGVGEESVRVVVGFRVDVGGIDVFEGVAVGDGVGVDSSGVFVGG